MDTPTPQQQEIFRSIFQRSNQPGTFTHAIGITVTALGDGWAEAELSDDSRHCNPMGMVHGGCLSTLMDHTAGCAACTRGNTCLTVNCEARFLRPAAGRLHGRAAAVRMGRQVGVFRTEVRNAAGELCAEGIYTMRLYERKADQ
jgi:acyl-CoA thioesterase